MNRGLTPCISVDTGILGWPRVNRLAELMHTSPEHGVGLIVCFWARTFNIFKSQVIPKDRIREVWGLPSEYLIMSGFIHPSENPDCIRCVHPNGVQSPLLSGYYIVHDWANFAFSWLLEEKRAEIRKKQDLARQRKRRANLEAFKSGRVADQTLKPYRVTKLRTKVHQGLRKAPVKVRERMAEEIKKIEKLSP